MNLALLFLGAYLLGAVPVGVMVARSRGVDIRKVGSGNIGATNVARALGKWWFYPVFLMDVAKGLIPALEGRALFPDGFGFFDGQTLWFLAGVAAIVGHCFSPFLGFKGGKGVATALGAVIGAAPVVAASCLGTFLVIFGLTKYISLASVIALPASVVYGLLIPGNTVQLVPVYAILSAFVVYRHRANIRRLAQGTEPKFGQKPGEPKQGAETSLGSDESETQHEMGDRGR